MRVERRVADERAGERERVVRRRREVGGGVRQQHAARRQVARLAPHRVHAQRARPRRAVAAVALRPVRVWGTREKSTGLLIR